MERINWGTSRSGASVRFQNQRMRPQRGGFCESAKLLLQRLALLVCEVKSAPSAATLKGFYRGLGVVKGEGVASAKKALPFPLKKEKKPILNKNKFKIQIF